MIVKAPLLSLRARWATRALFAETEAQLNREFDSWTGPFVADPKATHILVWDDRGTRRVQVATTLKFNPGNSDLKLHVILSHPLHDAFDGAAFSDSFRAAWFVSAARRMNDEMARGWEFTPSSNDSTEFLKPWETVKFDAYTRTSFRARVVDEFTDVTLRERVIEYTPINLDEEEEIFDWAELHGVRVSTHNLIDFAGRLVASNDEAASIEFLLARAENDVERSSTPENWMGSNHPSGSSREPGAQRRQAVRALGPYTTPVVAASNGKLTALAHAGA